MKGVIVVCLAELIKSQFSEDKWHAVLEDAGLPGNKEFLLIDNVEDGVVLKILDSIRKVLNLTLNQASDAFGEYWVNVYAPKIYGAYFRQSHSAKELLLNMDRVHKTVTATIADSKPPRFDYEWKDDNTLIMVYKSERGMIDYLVGLIKGVGKYFKENIAVRKLGSTKVEVTFPK
jgi:hypothetical protein